MLGVSGLSLEHCGITVSVTADVRPALRRYSEASRASFVPLDELARAGMSDRLDDVPVLARRLRSYAASCQSLRPSLRPDDLLYLVASYAVSLAIPTHRVENVARAVVNGLEGTVCMSSPPSSRHDSARPGS